MASEARLRAVLDRAVGQAPGYPGVGATRAVVVEGAPLPAGWSHLAHTAAVGRGPDGLDVAGECIRTWGMQRGSGLMVVSTPPRAQPGGTVVVGIGVGPVRAAAPCRVLWTVDEPALRGFGYGTLPGHPETGEEAFVARLGADGVVRASVLAFSRPAAWYARAGGPLTRVAQGLAARAYVAAVRRACVRAGLGPR